MRYLKLLSVTVFCLASCLARAQEPSPNWQDILGPFPQPDELAERYSQGEEAYNAGKYKTALDLWKPAAEFGHADSQHGMCFLYWEGKGVEKNLQTAETWCAKAQRVDKSEYTYIYALIILEQAISSSDTEGQVRALMWMVIAEARGSDAAARFLENPESASIFQKAIEEARSRAKQLVPMEF